MKQLHVGFCRKFLFARIFFEKVHSSPKRGLFLIACMMVEDQEYLKTLYIAIVQSFCCQKIMQMRSKNDPFIILNSDPQP